MRQHANRVGRSARALRTWTPAWLLGVVLTTALAGAARADETVRVEVAGALLPALLPDVTPPQAPADGELPEVVTEDPGPRDLGVT